MFQKYLIVASKKDKAGTNITTALSQFGEYDFYLTEEEIIFTKSLKIEKIEKYDFIIFASKHQSEKGGKTLSVHIPGNFRNADFGGEKGKICLSSALFQKQLFENLTKNTKEHDIDYGVTLECTHHGPLINKPCIFIEIGSTETEWNDRKAAFVVAKTIDETVKNFKENPYNEIAVGIGGPHYCPSFNKIQLSSNVAISHIIPQYLMPISEEMIMQSIEKTIEEVDFVVVDWKGLGKSEQRQLVLDVFEKNHIQWKKTSEIEKE